MGRFLRENWPWIVTPIVLVLAGLFAIIKMTSGEGDAPFIYNIF